MKSKKITIFTTTTCAYCVMVKRFLDSKGAAYEVVNLDDQPERQAEVLAKSGALTVPVTLFQNDDDTEDVVIGYNLSRLAPLLA
jgi:glutaredoxin 3